MNYGTRLRSVISFLLTVCICISLVSGLTNKIDVEASVPGVPASFTYASGYSLGSAGNFAIFSKVFNKTNHMEGTFATAQLVNSGDAFGISPNVSQYVNPNENLIYFADLVSASDPHSLNTNNGISTSYIAFPNDATFDTTYNNGTGILVTHKDISYPFNNLSELNTTNYGTVQDLANEGYSIDFDAAFNSLIALSNTYASLDTINAGTTVRKVNNGDHNNRAYEITCVAGLNVITLSCQNVQNYKLNILTADGVGNNDYSLVINVTGTSPNGSYVFDKEVYFNGSTQGSYSDFGGKVLFNMIPSSNNNSLPTYNFKKSNTGFILAPKANVICSETHNGSVIANTVENSGCQIHQNRFIERGLATTTTPTATSTPVPTATSTPVPTATSTPVPTATSTPVPTATSTPVPTATSTPVPTATSTPVPTATSTPVPTATSTPVPTATSTPVPTATSTPVPTATSTPVPTATSTPVPTATSTPVPTATSTPVPTATSTPVPTATSTPVPTATSTPVPTNTSTPVPTVTSTPVPTVTSTPVPTVPARVVTPTPEPVATATPVPTVTSTPVPTVPARVVTPTPEPVATATPTAKPSVIPSLTPSVIPTIVPTPDPTEIPTPTPDPALATPTPVDPNGPEYSTEVEGFDNDPDNSVKVEDPTETPSEDPSNNQNTTTVITNNSNSQDSFKTDVVSTGEDEIPATTLLAIVMLSFAIIMFIATVRKFKAYDENK